MFVDSWGKFVIWFVKEYDSINYGDAYVDLRSKQGRVLEAKACYIDEILKNFPELKEHLKKK